MDKQKPKPPDFLGWDTSNEQLKYVPFLYLGLQHQYQYNNALPETKVATIRKKDVSGNYVCVR